MGQSPNSFFPPDMINLYIEHESSNDDTQSYLERIWMDVWVQVAAVIGMFVLRLGVPLGITALVGYWLHRLDAKWQAEALARRADNLLAQQNGAAEPEIEMFTVIDEPCWTHRGCSESAYLGCPAYRQAELPCWLARLRAEGRLPSPCHQCELFTAGQIRPRELAKEI
jgi:hypothetical protein